MKNKRMRYISITAAILLVFVLLMLLMLAVTFQDVWKIFQ